MADSGSFFFFSYQRESLCYLPALAGIAVASILTAPLGARLAHGIPVAQLKKFFALFLIVMGTRMLMGLW